MFFPQILLNKKGSLSRIWLAALWEQKIKRAHIFQIDIESSVQGIMSQTIVFDLRTTGHLLLGISKIYSRKAKYLLSECSDIFLKIKLAFRPGMISLPDNQMEAAIKTITLSENFNSFDENESIIIASANQSRPEAITLTEIPQNEIMIEDELDSLSANELDRFEEFSNIDDDFCSEGFLKNSEHNVNFNICNGEISETELIISHLDHEEELSTKMDIPLEDAELNYCFEDLMEVSQEIVQDQQAIVVENNRLINKDNFFLEPYQSNIRRKMKRKRKLILDVKKNMSNHEIQSQIDDTDDIKTTLDLAPPSKRLMQLKETGGAYELISLPGYNILSKKLLSRFQKSIKVQTKFGKPCKFSDSEEEFNSSDSAESLADTVIRKRAAVTEEDINSTPPDLPCNGLEDHNSIIEPCLWEDDKIDEISTQVQGGHFETNKNVGKDNFTNKDLEYVCNEHSNIESAPSESQDTSSHHEESFRERLASTLKTLHHLLEENESIPFSFLVKLNRRLKVAQDFFTILMLKKLQIVELEQEQPFKEIYISRGEHFDVACSHFLSNSAVNESSDVGRKISSAVLMLGL